MTRVLKKPPPDIRKCIAIGFVLIVALGIRLTFVFAYPQDVVKDAAGYDRLGKNIHQTGRMYPDAEPEDPQILTRTPVYPLFLAMVYGVAGYHHQAVRIAQCFLDVLMIFFILRIARYLGVGRLARFFAALLLAVNPFTSAYVSALLSENMSIFLLALSYVVLYVSIREGKTVWYVISGLLFGITTLCRPQFVLLLPLISLIPIFWRLKQYTSVRRYLPVPLILVLCLPYVNLLRMEPLIPILSHPFFLFLSPIVVAAWFIVPKEIESPGEKVDEYPAAKGLIIAVCVNVMILTAWTARNYYMSGKLVPLVTSAYPGGVGYYLYTQTVPWGKDPKEVDERWKKFLVTEGGEREKLRREMEEIGYRRLLSQPHSYLLLTFRRAVRLWNHGNLLYFYDEPRGVWAFFTVLTFLYYVLAGIGIWITRKRWRLLFPLYVPFIYLTILCAPGHVESRYSIEVFPIVCLFGGTCISFLIAAGRGKGRGIEDVSLSG